MKIPLKEMGPQTDTIFLEYNWAIDLKTIFKNILLAFRKGWNQKLNDVSKAALSFFFLAFLLCSIDSQNMVRKNKLAAPT